MKLAKDDLNQSHLHSSCRFKALDGIDYALAVRDLVVSKLINAKTLNFHLPYEIQFKSYRNLAKGQHFMDFVDYLAKLIKVKVVWENTNILNTKTWRFTENPSFIPLDRQLCFDLGHALLGSSTPQVALKQVDSYFKKHGQQIQHLHLHINDLKRDQHISDRQKVIKFLGQKRFNQITKNRSYIFEIDS